MFGLTGVEKILWKTH